ncbi:MAG: hypothetical protein ACREC6_09500 [Hyphomicrobiaceae bacterium]
MPDAANLVIARGRILAAQPQHLLDQGIERRVVFRTALPFLDCPTYQLRDNGTLVLAFEGLIKPKFLMPRCDNALIM